MALPGAWNVLRAAEGPGLVLACDFPATSRPVATFAELTELLTADHTFWETAPPPGSAGPTGADLVARWLDDVRTAGTPVHAVLGFCTGALYAGALAERIAGWQDPPRLILLDPEPARAGMLADSYDTLITRRLAGLLGPEETAEAVRAGHRLDLDGDLPRLAEQYAGLVRAAVEPAFARAGLPADRIAEFIGISTSYLYWIAAADALDDRARWAGATAVNSAGPDAGLHCYAPADRVGLVARAIHLDVSHAGLMRSTETARVVDDLLRAAPR
ncbi:hypothetical protein ACFCX4_26755 [Kitasatospora sp. NPDC056327]|uniref:hypothetical protein n=1 Tax=Kitasatospora sp. NPDC056327 TaxID=3345785 RepID=UPI0035E179EA